MPAYFNNPYQPYYQQVLPQQFSQPQQQPQQTQQIQNGGFIPVPSEDVARNYPVAPGNSVTFKNENAPYVYTKTMGFSQLDRPIFEKYKLVREEDASVSTQETHTEPKTDLIKDDVADELKSEIEALWDEINAIKKQTKKPAIKTDKSGGD